MTVSSCRIVFHDVFVYASNGWQYRHVELSFSMYLCMKLTYDSTVMSSCLSRCICVCS